MLDHTTITAREITGSWPSRASTCRDRPDTIVRVIDGEAMTREATESRNQPTAWSRAIHKSETARFYIRHTDSMTYVICLYFGDGTESTRVFYGTAGGYGYDRAAAAAAGMPVAPGVVLTDHCGLDRFPAHGLTCGGRPMREVLMHKGSDRDLPGALFTI